MRPPGFQPPTYSHSTLPQVLPGIARSLGVAIAGDGESPGAAGAPGHAGEASAYGLPLQPAQRAVVVLLDGFGLELLRRRSGHVPFLRSLLPESVGLTCGFPSTTATSLASFGTGRPPGEHGLIGYQSIIPGTGRIFDHLSWEGGPDPLAWQPDPTVFEAVAAAGIAVTRIGLARFDGSGLTVAAQRGGRFVGASSLSKSVRATVAAIQASPRVLVYLYWGDIDKNGHMFGSDSPECIAAMEEADTALRQLAEQLPADTSLTITADHGMIDVPFADRIDLRTDPELDAGIAAITHEPRAPHVYCLPGAAESVAQTWTGRFGDRALVLTREQAIDEGWFGPVAARNHDRIGDLVAAFGPGVAVEDSRTAKPVLLTLLGLHGSLTPDETAIPLLHRPAAS